MVSVQPRKEQATYAISRGLNQRRAYTLLNIGRSSLYYSYKMPVKDAPVIKAMKKLSGMYPRFGYRRIQIFLQRDGIHLGKDRCGRLWAQAGLQVPRKRRRKRTGLMLRPFTPTSQNSVWSYDFVYDAFANGQKLKCLTVVEEYTRECLAINVSGAIRSSQVIEILSKLMKIHGVPRYLRSDNGFEFVSKALLEWQLSGLILFSEMDNQFRARLFESAISAASFKLFLSITKNEIEKLEIAFVVTSPS